jgi:hypothetical protein
VILDSELPNTQFLSTNSTDAGMTIELSEQHPEIADPSIRVSFGPNDKTERRLHPRKQDLRITVTKGGRVMARIADL